uniref:NPHS1 adhesion molecule, nephrin n=1 Tax=Echeneis naucrates TaxID=173247 RepID=A0A665VUV2_ECHNA
MTASPAVHVCAMLLLLTLLELIHPLFLTEPRNLTVRMGATAVLRCEVLRASGTVQWVKDGLLLGPQRSLPGFPRYSMIGNPKRGQYHLQIEQAQLEDDAAYECQAGQSESSQAIVSKTALLNVLIPPSNPHLKVDMATPWVAGKEYTVICNASEAKPVANVTLYKGDYQIPFLLLLSHPQFSVTLFPLPFVKCFLSFVSHFLTVAPPQPPVIVGLEREEVKAGRMLLLECVSHGGNPLATLHWTKEAIECSTHGVIFFTDLALYVLPLYVCMSVEPAEVILSGSFTAIAGQMLILSCFATSSNPPVEIRWWLGSKELNTTVVTMDKTHIHLITDPPQKVWLEAPPQDVPFNAGTKVRLICFSTGGNPTGTLNWFKVSVYVEILQTLLCPVTNALKQTSFDRGVTQELVLLLTASDNMATYRCDARNEAKKTISAHTKLMVHFTPISMKIMVKQEELRLGQIVTLECRAGSSNPKANITWSLGTVRFQGVEQLPEKAQYGGVSVCSSLSLNLSSQHHNQKVICQAYSPVLSEGTNTFFRLNVLCKWRVNCFLISFSAFAPLSLSLDLRYHWPDEFTLEIKNVSRKDAGVYAIKCSNSEGVSQISVTLDVQYAPGVKTEKNPVFVNMGETADLICVADANPIISDMFSWKWLVEMGEETQQDESGLLTIHDVTRAHAGLYQCTANNGIAPPASVVVQLVVQCKFSKGAQWRKVASRGDGTTTAKVVCHAEGLPGINFFWEKNGARLDFANPRYEEQTVREGAFHTSTVRVINVSAAQDYAVFSCTARNSLGEDKLDIQLVSTSHPDPPSLFHKVSATHHSVTLEWVPGFNGGLQQRFRVRYRSDQSVSYLYMDVFPPTATTFAVTGLQPATTYNFSVNALNAMGESDYADNNAVLTITTKVIFLMFCELGEEGLPPYLTIVLTVVFGVLLVLNSLGCVIGQRWKKRKNQTGNYEHVFICSCASVPSIMLCHYNFLIPPQNSKEITLNHDAIVSSASRSLLISPCPSSIRLPCLFSFCSSCESLPPATLPSLRAVTSMFRPYLLSHLPALCPSSIPSSVSFYLFFRLTLNLSLSIMYFSFLTFLCPLVFFIANLSFILYHAPTFLLL